MKLIVNADDFGLSERVNRAIHNSAKGGYITSATIMAVAPYLDEAADMSKELKEISFGIHLTFDDALPSLSGKPKFFDKNNIVNIRGLNLFKVNIIVDEFSKQIEKLLKLGINISHIDTHHHIHLYPLVLCAVARVSKKYNIKKARSQRIIAKKSFLNKNYRLIHYNISKFAGLIQPSFYTDFPTYLGDNEYNKYDNEAFEIMCHPGSEYNDEQYFNSDIYDTFKANLINYNQLS